MLKQAISFFAIIISFFLLASCKKEVLPKPTSQLRLDYKVAAYDRFENNCAYSFDMNADAVIKEKTPCNFEINYPKLKATIYLSYKPINNNLKLLLRDAQKLTYEHVIKADAISDQPFMNPENKVYGMFYQVSGNAATNAQFYVTDSTKNFVDCSLYFYAKPNFDSVYPAVSYVKNDMRRLMESLKWRK
jgi:gliding motility-associated lipoprotein GldD